MKLKTAVNRGRPHKGRKEGGFFGRGVSTHLLTSFFTLFCPLLTSPGPIHLGISLVVLLSPP
jgi:hypothetical protein